MEPQFVTCLNCIDGRAQLPVIQWIAKNYPVDFVDMITEPGMDGILADEDSNLDEILRKLDLSRDAHNTDELFIVGHYDCAVNPVDTQTNHEQIKQAVMRVKMLRPHFEVYGLWLANKHSVELVF